MMKYLPQLLLRIILCFIPFSIFYFLFLPLTLYTSYLFVLPLNPSIQHNALQIKDTVFVFVEACIASAAYWLLWVLVLLLKDVDLKKRIKLILTCFSLFFAMNVFRIVLLVYLDHYYGRAAFDLVHLTFWKFVSGVYVAFVWIFAVKIHKVHAIPLYDDLNYIYKKSLFKRLRSGKPKDPH